MKKIIAIIILACITVGAHAQVANTKWKGTLNLDSPVDAFFNFGKDTLEVLNPEDNSNIESMRYSIQDSIITLQKLFGHSSCDTTPVGKYKFQIKGDQMTLKVIADDCDDRAQVIGDMKLTKEK